jgi:hypothetical protein
MTTMEIIVAIGFGLIVVALSEIRSAINSVGQQMHNDAERQYGPDGKRVRTAAEEIAWLRTDLARASWRLDREEGALKANPLEWILKAAAQKTEENDDATK